MGDESDCDSPASGVVRSEFERLVKEQGPTLFQLVYRALRHPQDTEDLVQAGFLKAIEAIKDGKVHDSERLRSWLYTVVWNCLLDELRHRTVRRRRESGDELAEDRSLAHAKAPEQATSVDLLAVLLFVQSLPSDQQQVWSLREVHGHTAPEVAKLLGIATGTVASRLKAAREKVRNFVQHGQRVALATPVPESEERRAGREALESHVEGVLLGELPLSAKGQQTR